MSDYSLLILCAGFGKRMLNLTKDIPKPLLKVKDKNLLGNAINFFSEIGFNEIFINTHYLHYRIENYINKNFNNYPINLIYEPTILGTGGGVKNIFNYTQNKKICVVNSDILWQMNNKSDILNFIDNFNDVDHCKILLSYENNFFGLKKNQGDFNIQNGVVSQWSNDNKIIIYSGLQIVSKNIFEQTPTIFSMNKVWNNLINEKKLFGDFMRSNIIHIGDKNTFDQF